MAAPIKVAVFGATGETGGSIVEGLLASPTNFEITAVTRPTSTKKDIAQAFREKGIKVASVELAGPQEAIVDILKGIDVVIAAVFFLALDDQKYIIDACKTAGVKRFIPCTFQPTMPPTGVMALRETKEKWINYTKKAGIGYTVIDVAWWYQIVCIKLPSGRTDYTRVRTSDHRWPGDGSVPIALADLRSVGPYVARIIADPRTLNKYVYVYDDVRSAVQMLDAVDKASGEKSVREFIPEQKILGDITEADAMLAKDPNDMAGLFQQALNQYWNSWGLRGDSTPERAKYLGYLDSRELYPDIKPFTLEEYIDELLAGKVRPVHQDL